MGKKLTKVTIIKFSFNFIKILKNIISGGNISFETQIKMQTIKIHNLYIVKLFL